MKNKTSQNNLNETISLLRYKQAHELKLLKDQLDVASESLKPLNLIKSAWHDLSGSPDFKSDMLGNAIGLTTGYLSKKVFVGTSHNPVKKILGMLVQFAITNIVSKHTDSIKSIGKQLIQRIGKNKKTVKQEFADHED